MYAEIKQILIENIDLVIDILESTGFSDIKPNSREIRCALPDGDNYTSVQIYKNTLSVNVWSRSEYSNFDIHDFFTLIAFALNIRNYEALSYVCKFLNIEEGEVEKYEKSQALSQIRYYKTRDVDIETNVLGEHILSKYKKMVVEDWEKEGIIKEAQDEFEVCVDEKERRWCFPLRNIDGKLIGVKGRTYVKDFEVLRIPKYLYYFSKGNVSHLYNSHRAKFWAEKYGELIIVESEKSVMKLWAMGFYNVVAIGNKKISDNLVKQILSINCKKLVFALDKDVCEDDVKVECRKFRLFRECYFILDKENVLGKKDAPCDKGKEIWSDLYEKRKRAV